MMSRMTTTEQFRALYKHDARMEKLREVGLKILSVAIVPPMALALTVLLLRG